MSFILTNSCFCYQISALEKDSSLPLPVPTFISNLAHQYGGGGPLSILLTGGGLNDVLQSLSNFGPNPGPATFYGSTPSGDPPKDVSNDAESDASAEDSSSSNSESQDQGPTSTNSSQTATPAPPSPNSSSRPDSFCVATGRLCQSLIALQPCCNGKPCMPFSQSFLNAFALGNLGTCQ